MSTEKQLVREIGKLQKELNAIRQDKENKKNSRLIGKCFKYENSYSGLDAKTWWFYIQMNKIEDGSLVGTSFQHDEYGEISIGTNDSFHAGTIVEDSHIEITKDEFDKAFNDIKVQINNI